MSERLLTVVIDVPRGSLLKRDDDGAIEFVSPLPCPFNYGHVPDSTAEDGDGVDAVALGRRLGVGATTTLPIRGHIGFIDAGQTDSKWICAAQPLSSFQRLQISSFFRLYAHAKRMINWLRGKSGPTRYLGWL